MKKNKISKRLGAVGATGLAALLLLFNIVGTHSFFENFGKAWEASAFNGPAGYQGVTPTTASATMGRVSLIPLGKTFGIKLYTDGIIVSSLAEVYTEDKISCPAKEAGIEPGDYIIAVNGTKAENNVHFSELLAASLGDDIVLTLQRDAKEFNTTLVPVYDGTVFRCGMWIRDSAAGIGTLTFVNPVDNSFAGLGHGICDIDSNQLMSLRGGEPAEITICNIEKGEKSKPGKINGYFSGDTGLGSLFRNNQTGIYGTFDALPPGKAIPLAFAEEVKTGPAQILVTIDETGPTLFDAKIERLITGQETKNLVIRITDADLLNRTGGIIQGMSGTPILQNGKLVAAVTHVFIDDPERGYGIFAETMYKNSQKSP